MTWTTCPRCRGSGWEPLEDGGDSDDECALCRGDGGVEDAFDEDDPANVDDVDVKDED